MNQNSNSPHSIGGDTTRTTLTSAKNYSIEKSRLLNYLRTVPEKEDRHIKVIPNVLYKLVGFDHHAATMLSQMLWWSGKTNNSEGWFYKTRQQWQDELFMTEWQVRKSLDLVSSLGFVETTQRKIHNVKTSHYRVLADALMNAIMEITEPGFDPEQRNSPAPSGEFLHSFTYTKGGEKGNISAERILPPEPELETIYSGKIIDTESSSLVLMDVGLLGTNTVKISIPPVNGGEKSSRKRESNSRKSAANRKVATETANQSRHNHNEHRLLSLASIWKEFAPQCNESHKYIKPLTVADYSKLKHVELSVAPDAEETVLNGSTMGDVLKDVLKHWDSFRCYVEFANGHYKAPDQPQIGFFTANAGHAVNWWLERKEKELQYQLAQQSSEDRKKSVPRTLVEAKALLALREQREACSVEVVG